MHQFYISCARGLEELLAKELEALPVHAVKLTQGGVFCEGERDAAYLMCLHLRTASRVLLLLHTADVRNRDELLAASMAVDWRTHVDASESFAVRFSGSNEQLRHTGFSAQVVKDGYLDYWRRYEQRPSVDKEQPGVNIYVYLHRDVARFFIDLSGFGLHERGYRMGAGSAPIRETLAAAVALRSLNALNPDQDIDTVADPCCGSATLLIETALILMDGAPGLLRAHWGFFAWNEHAPDRWREIKDEASQRFEAGKAACKTRFLGSDIDAKVLGQAHQNVHAANLHEHFSLLCVDATTPSWVDFVAPSEAESPNGIGLIISNPPYGERLETPLAARIFYRKLGDNLRQLPESWNAAVLAPSEAMLKALRLRSAKKYTFYSGPLTIKLGTFSFANQGEFYAKDNTDIANRLKKNWQQRQKWAKREGVEAFRVYDADLPEYNAAIDCYGEHLVVQEYAAPKDIPDYIAESRWWDLIDAILVTMPFSAEHIHTKQRRRQQGDAQYVKQESNVEPVRFEVQEYNAKFWVNLTEYLDTGLFLDHRVARKTIQKLAHNKRVLNLFAYTGAASVHAGLGGASHITTVDMSRTYLNWAKDNFRLNYLTLDKHDFIQADCLKWLQEAAQQQEKWDLIFLDPPTFSNSKRMESVFDIERDHLALIQQAASILSPDGLLIFSTNKRRFKIAQAELEALGLNVTDKTQATIPEDFKRQRAIHYCWYIEHA